MHVSVYNAQHINHDTRLLFLGRWWWCFGHTRQKQENQVIRSFVKDPILTLSLPEQILLGLPYSDDGRNIWLSLVFSTDVNQYLHNNSAIFKQPVPLDMAETLLTFYSSYRSDEWNLPILHSFTFFFYKLQDKMDSRIKVHNNI
jgi:hypothetical protein